MSTEDSGPTVCARRGVARLRAIGALPPPLGGATVNFEIFVREVQEHRRALGVGSLQVTNTSPGAYRLDHALTPAAVVSAARIAAATSTAIGCREAIVFFCSERSFLAAAPFLLAARASGLPVVTKFVGQALDAFLRGLSPIARRGMVAALNEMTAVLCQTQDMLEEVRRLGVSNGKQSAGYRRVNWSTLPPPRRTPPTSGGLRLVYLGLVAEAKGVHDALRALSRLNRADISFDLFGEAPQKEQQSLNDLLSRVPNATMRGICGADKASLLADYDALILPTFHYGEGHPGVVIEAMAAGIPVIVSRFRALPELVVDRENGLLVEPHDVDAIASAIEFLADHPDERLMMGNAHRRRLVQHDAARSVAAIVDLLR